jgi:hypothetical protein
MEMVVMGVEVNIKIIVKVYKATREGDRQGYDVAVGTMLPGPTVSVELYAVLIQ